MCRLARSPWRSGRSPQGMDTEKRVKTTHVQEETSRFQYGAAPEEESSGTTREGVCLEPP
jgi:hypothetical protein